MQELSNGHKTSEEHKFQKRLSSGTEDVNWFEIVMSRAAVITVMNFRGQ
jgi:hypothetical protein